MESEPEVADAEDLTGEAGRPNLHQSAWPMNAHEPMRTPWTI